MADEPDVLAARLARARSRAVMIATPVARAPCLEYTIALTETCVMLEKLGIRYGLQFVVGSSNLPRARNELVARFLASDCTDLLFIDDDMGWSPEAVVRVLASEQMVIGGVGRKRVDKPNADQNVWCVAFEAESTALVQDEMRAIRVEGVGTGFLKIARPVFEALAASHPEWKRRGHEAMSEKVKAHYHSFFAFDDGNDDVGEDYVFCRRVRALGGEIWIDPQITLAHVGSKSYSGCIGEILQVAENFPK